MVFDKANYLNSSLIQRYLPYINKLSDQFYKDHHVKFLSYIKQYDNGKSVEFCTHVDWMAHRIAHFNHHKAILPRLIIGNHFWHKSDNEVLQQMAKAAKQHFAVDAIIEFVYRDNIQSCFHMYSFYANPLYATKAHDFYLRHKAKLLRLMANVNNKNYQYFTKEDESEIAIQVIGYYLKKNQIETVKGFTDLLEEKLYFKLSDYEMEIITLYGAGGFTAKQIAEMINKSPKTIEYHISQIRNKTNLKDRKAMNAYAREKGWDKLVNFYSNLNNSNAQATSN